MARTCLPPLTVVFLAVLAQPALAHVGHLGELAGHAHWAGVAAVAAAAAITGVLIVRGRRKGKAEEQEAAEDENVAESQ